MNQFDRIEAFIYFESIYWIVATRFAHFFWPNYFIIARISVCILYLHIYFILRMIQSINKIPFGFVTDIWILVCTMEIVIKSMTFGDKYIQKIRCVVKMNRNSDCAISWPKYAHTQSRHTEYGKENIHYSSKRQSGTLPTPYIHSLSMELCILPQTSSSWEYVCLCVRVFIEWIQKWIERTFTGQIDRCVCDMRHELPIQSICT